MPAIRAAEPDQEGHTVPTVARIPIPLDLAEQRTVRVCRYPVVFTGSGSRYLSLWLRQGLLTLMTLGLYWPWGRAARLRYFHRQTQLYGQAFDFTGRSTRMLRVPLWGMTLFALAAWARHAPPTTRLGIVVGTIWLWPALLHASMRYRLTHAQWAGHSVHFSGRMRQAYIALGLPLAIVMGVAATSLWLAMTMSQSDPRQAGLISTLPTLLAAIASTPWGWWRWQTHVRRNVTLGPRPLQCRVTLAESYALYTKTALMGLLSVAGACALFGWVAALAVWSQPTGNVTPMTTVLHDMLPLLMFFLLIASLAPVAYFVSRSQNLLWSRTGNEWIRFKSELEFSAVWGLALKNAMLLTLTLGLYWPFASIDWMRLRLQALSVHTRQPLA